MEGYSISHPRLKGPFGLFSFFLLGKLLLQLLLLTLKAGLLPCIFFLLLPLLLLLQHHNRPDVFCTYQILVF